VPGWRGLADSGGCQFSIQEGALSSRDGPCLSHPPEERSLQDWVFCYCLYFFFLSVVFFFFTVFFIFCFFFLSFGFFFYGFFFSFFFFFFLVLAGSDEASPPLLPSYGISSLKE